MSVWWRSDQSFNLIIIIEVAGAEVECSVALSEDADFLESFCGVGAEEFEYGAEDLFGGAFELTAVLSGPRHRQQEAFDSGFSAVFFGKIEDISDALSDIRSDGKTFHNKLMLPFQISDTNHRVRYDSPSTAGLLKKLKPIKCGGPG